MSESIYGIRGVSPFAATLQGRKQPRDRRAPPSKSDGGQPINEQDEQPLQPDAAPNRLDVTI